MTYLLLIPALIAFVLIIRGCEEKAFFSVYLPLLFLSPETYAIHLPHLPALSAAELTLIPVGAAALRKLVVRHRFSALDGLVCFFLMSVTLSEVLHEPVRNDGIQISVYFLISVLLAYATGKAFIEPGLRLAVAKRIVVMLLLLGPVGIWEFRLGINPYGIVGQKLFHVAAASTVQLRSGRGRMSASFSNAEIGGIVFGMIFCLNRWLTLVPQGNRNGYLERLQRYHIPALLLILYMFLTQSRGPLLSLLLAIPILLIPSMRNRKRAVKFAAVLVLAGACGAYAYYDYYTAQKNRFIPGISEQQSSAVYRRHMNERYAPLVEKGGWLGWGVLGRPVLPGMSSVDNEFLLVHLTGGHLGFILLILLALESLRHLAVQCWRLRNDQEVALAYSLLAALFIFWTAILTVYLGEQLPQVAFLLLGWSNAIEAPAVAPVAKFQFQRVYT